MSLLKIWDDRAKILTIISVSLAHNLFKERLNFGVKDNLWVPHFFCAVSIAICMLYVCIQYGTAIGYYTWMPEEIQNSLD